MDGERGERELISLVERLWDIECRHLLGSLSEPEYRQALAAVRGVPPAAHPVKTERTLEMEYE